MKSRIILELAIVALLISCGEKQKPTSNHTGHTAVLGPTYADSVNSGIIREDTLRGSVVRVAMDFIGSNHVHIEYGSPGVRGRVIWGGVVAYDHVWATGAHHATSIDFSRDVVVLGTRIKAGRYAFFTIPGRETWTLILNANWDQHLTDEYSASQDLVRLNVKPEFSDTLTQRLTYHLQKISSSEGAIAMKWERIRVTLPFENEKK